MAHNAIILSKPLLAIRRFELGKIDLADHLGAASLAAAFSLFLTSPPLGDARMGIAVGLTVIGTLISPKGSPSRVALIGCGIIVFSTWLAAIFSYFLQETSFIHTVWLAVITSTFAPLLWLKTSKLLYQWLIPVWLIHAGVALFQWLIDYGHPRVLGIAANQNPGAQFLLLGCIFLMNGNSRVKWLILPLIAALPFTGSRWVGVVAAVIFVMLFATKSLPLKWIIVGIVATMFLVALTGWNDLQTALIRENTLGHHLGGLPSQPNLPISTIPRGFYDSGIHVAVWRMAHEIGIISALAWLGVSGYALRKLHWRSHEWSMLLAIMLLSVMYADVWVGPLGGFWWLLVRGSRY